MSCAAAHLCCCPLKMLLRMLRFRLGARLSVNQKPGFNCASNSFLQTVLPLKYDSKARTHSDPPGTWVFSRTWDLKAHHQHQRDTRRVLPALSGINFTSTLLTDPGTLAKYEQKRFYLVPKGPRTKQPSRANQSSLNENQVTDQINHLLVSHVMFCLNG